MSAQPGLEAPAPSRSRRWYRFARRHPVLIVFGLLIGALGTAVVAWLVYLNALASGIPRFDADLDRSGRPARVPGAAVNLLVAGVDDGQGTDLRRALTASSWPAGVFRSDTIMLLHLSADGRRAQLVSIPRDSYVKVPGHGRTKINASFSYGGPALLTATVERLTGLRLDHVAVVDLDGFRGLTDAVGGVVVATPGGGSARLDGDGALTYVRERRLPRGDLDRVLRQQHYLRALLEQATDAGVLTNPVRITRLVGSITDHLAVDEGLDDGALRALVLRSRHLRPANVRFLTVPVRGLGTVDGASVVLLDLPATRRLFAAVATERLDDWRGLREVVQPPPVPQ